LALNSTPRRRFGVGLGVVLTGVTAGLIGFAGIASAHTHDVNAVCKGDTTVLTVNLKSYADGTKKGKENHVKITDNGGVLLDTGFQSKLENKTFQVSGATKHDFVVDVTAWDSKQYNAHEEVSVEACVTTPPSTETTTTTTTTTTTEVTAPPSSSTEAPPVVATSTTPPPPAAQGGPLAETGASIALPLGIAGVLIIGGVGALFVVRRRSKA
jgi:LPXTG-motif cell wall-anchored protein